jgi:hypothetical protein
MVRGYQKRIIYLKNTRSRYFDEAYFVVKEDRATESAPHDELVEEANRIIEENCPAGEDRCDTSGVRFRLRGALRSFFLILLITVIPFLLGAFASLLVLI